MIISDKHKYIFIAIPKTGTTAIQSFLLEQDESCVWNVVNIGGEQIKINEHIMAKDLKKIMGEKYNEYTVFTFIREPFARRVSGYFFYKKTADYKKSRYISRRVMARLNIYLTKILPFSVWSVIKPQKKIADYFFDDNGDLLIDLVGKTKNLDEDLLSICRKIGIPIEDEKVPVKNKSQHASTENYYSNTLHKKLYKKLISEDLEIYHRYQNTLCTEKYESKHIIYD